MIGGRLGTPGGAAENILGSDVFTLFLYSMTSHSLGDYQ
jgi:hypothetical protein